MKVQLKLTGIRPLVMHNGRLADPLDSITKAIKEVSGKRKKTDADQESIARLEFEGGLYWDDKLGVVIPADNIERCVQIGAQKSKLGKDVQATVFCSEPMYKLQYDGPKDIEKLYKGKFFLRRGVKVTTSRVMRVRPMFPTGWTLTIDLEYDETVLNESNIIRAVEDAGARVGLGDWRPKFGRFIVEKA